MDYIVNRLSSLRSRDRDWLLGQLSENERAVIASLMNEPASTGAPDPVVSGELGSDRDRSLHPDLDQNDGFQMIDAMGTSEITALFADESMPGIALMLAVRPWRWTERYLFSLPPEHVHELKAMTPRLAPLAQIPAVRQVVMQHIGDRARSLMQPPSGTSNIFDRVLDSIETESLTVSSPGGP